jgi:hypothetical protein
MAHQCPECYAICHCGGDAGEVIITDHLLEGVCVHCQVDDDYDDDDGYEDDDDVDQEFDDEEEVGS